MARIEYEDKLKIIKRTRVLMGTVVEIQVKEDDRSLGESAIADAFSEIERIENLFTTYNDTSAIQRINQSKDTLISVSSEIYKMMALCDSLWKISDGAFDISLNNLIKVWDFENEEPAVPEKEEIEDALRNCGWENISLLSNYRFFRDAEVELNFGAIAKGYAVDRAIDVVKKRGIKNVLVNAGGEITSFGSDWIIGIKDPRNSEQIIESVVLGEMSIATSGDYENFFEFNGKRYHHILNPFTGFPADSIISVSVLHQSNTIADALATAVFVLGPTRGLELIENTTDSEVLIIDKNNRKLYSKGFVEYRN
jgi:thiamine biosynthesis lipoprotein